VLAYLAIDIDKLNELRRLAGLESDAELARRMGASPSSLHRALTGSNPGNEFIASLLAVFGGERWFEQLFTILPKGKK
jgi:transcriptional regulator with XRE-family HTH domain